MKRHRFFYHQLVKTTHTLHDKELVHQIARVLKLKAGEEIVLWNGDGNEYIFNLEQVTGREIQGAVVRIEKNDREPIAKVVLYCAILKRENFELVCQKATEVGVSAIVPLMTDRTVKTAINADRLQRIVQEAAEQSGRALVPKLHPIITLCDALKGANDSTQNYFLDTNMSDAATASFLLEKTLSGMRLFIGPEGGWSDAERELAQKAHCTFVSLGALTLRAETAAIIASYIAARL